MAIHFANGNDSTKISAPPRVVNVFHTGAGCPPAETTFLSLSFTIANPAAVYLVGRNIRYFNGRTDLYLLATGPNGWNNSGLRTRLNYTNGPQWESTIIRYTAFLSTTGTYTFYMSGAANAWGCPGDTSSFYGMLSATIFEN